MVTRIEDQKIETVTKTLDPLKEPDFVTPQDVLGVAIPKKPDNVLFAKYDSKVVESDEGLKFNIAVTKSRF